MTQQRDEEIRQRLTLGEDSRPQPVHFVPGETLQLTDSDGVARLVRIVEIAGRSALVEHGRSGARE